MHNGLADYLDIMHLAGVTDVPRQMNVRNSIASNTVVSNSVVSNTIVNDSIVSDRALARAEPTESTRAEARPLACLTSLQALAGEVAKCQKCMELAGTRTQTVFGSGNPEAELVFIGEAPGADEDKQGVPFVGRAGQLLTDIIVKGMKMRREDVYICNILRCRPPGNRNPLPDEAAACRPFLDATLDLIKPRYICCLGAVAAKNLLQSESTIGQLRGKVLEYRGMKVICTYHPAYLLRNPSAKKDTWNDIQILLRVMEKTV
jgi:DNA polymerase